MGRGNEIRRLIELAEQLRGPMAQHVASVQNAVARRNDPAIQLARRRARLARKRAWASRWLTVWALITSICAVAQVLRRVAAQLHAVERARDHSPPLERAPLADAVHRLRTQLDEGVDGYGSLVAAAGRVLAASSLGEPKRDLTEATDHLAGLALALSDLSPPD